MAGASAPAPQAAGELLGRVDHLVYVTPDLEEEVDRLEKLLGVRATPGGRHPGRGTRNALVALGAASYLEILAPDPEQPVPESPRWLGTDGPAPRLAAWAAKGTDLDRLVAAARRGGVEVGEALSGSRRRDDGVLLSWRFTDPSAVVADGVVPFFIDWGDTPHPARTAAAGVTLTGLRAEHPEAGRAREMLGRLGIPLPVETGRSPALVATLRTPRGSVELR